MPTHWATGVVKPNRQRIIEGATLLERAQKAMDALRKKEVSGERFVWRVAERMAGGKYLSNNKSKSWSYSSNLFTTQAA